MGTTNTTATNLASALAAISGVRGASSVPPDTIPGTPYCVVGAPKGKLTPGSWEIIEYTFPVDYLIARTSSEDRDQKTINDALDAVIAAFRSGITLSGAVDYALIDTFDTEKFYKGPGNEDYQSIQFTVQVLVATGETYTA